MQFVNGIVCGGGLVAAGATALVSGLAPEPPAPDRSAERHARLEAGHLADRCAALRDENAALRREADRLTRLLRLLPPRIPFAADPPGGYAEIGPADLIPPPAVPVPVLPPVTPSPEDRP